MEAEIGVPPGFTVFHALVGGHLKRRVTGAVNPISHLSLTPRVAAVSAPPAAATPANCRGWGTRWGRRGLGAGTCRLRGVFWACRLLDGAAARGVLGLCWAQARLRDRSVGKFSASTHQGLECVKYSTGLMSWVGLEMARCNSLNETTSKADPCDSTKTSPHKQTNSVQRTVAPVVK